MPFRITHEDSACRARTGLLALRHGTVTTPAFMPVGTNATVKAMTSENLEALGVNLILCNAYHLYLRPGKHLIERAGGLHRFMSWKHNILTDSGGFQIFSLAPLRKIEKEGVCFRSHVDGSLHRLTPEDCLALQCSLGSDVLMPLDVCTPYGIPQQEALDASTTTTQWAVRTLSAWQNHDSSFKGELFGIIQGNFYADLRRRSADEIVGLDFAGNAIGGLSVGEPQEMFIECLESCAALTPKHKPLYVMGIGTPEYILEAVERGVDLFDCVLPTRTARNGQAFTRRGPLSLRNSPSASDLWSDRCAVLLSHLSQLLAVLSASLVQGQGDLCKHPRDSAQLVLHSIVSGGAAQGDMLRGLRRFQEAFPQGLCSKSRQR